MNTRTSAERLADSAARLKADGGARKSFRLPAQALQDLAAVRDTTGARDDTEAIINALRIAATSTAKPTTTTFNRSHTNDQK